jgi:hypothetical protein
MIRMRNVQTLLVTTALAIASASCGDVARTGKAPMFLVIDLMQGQRGGGTGQLGNPLVSDVVTLKTTPAPCTTTTPCPTYFNDTGSVTLRLVPKDIGNPTVPAAPSTNNEVTITRFHVVYKRADGRNQPGVDVPWPFDGAATGTVQIGSQLTLAFELVRNSAKQEAPLAALIFAPQILTTIADVTFYGADRVGNEISVTGSIQIDFGNFGDF